MNAAAKNHFHLVDDVDIAAMTFTMIDRIGGLGAKIVEKVRIYGQRVNDRRALAQLDDRLLTDIGLIPADIDRETQKYFWQK